MKISSIFLKIKQSAVVAGMAAWAVGCAAGLSEAPFPARPDTTEPGDLAGPFEGRAVDAATGKPISGATVFGSWRLEIGHGLVAPAGAVVATSETDSDGHYRLEPLNNWPGRRTRVSRFTLVIYKRGYVAYRSDRRFDDLGARSDFAQQGNLAKLDLFTPAMSHVKHVWFVGGGGPLKEQLRPELVQASLELSEGVRPIGPTATGPVLDAAALLSEDELRAATGFTGAFAVERLADLPQSPIYDSRHFRATGQPESFDAAVRVWKLPTVEAAEARWRTLLREVPHAEPGSEIGDASLRGFDGKILAAAALDRARGVVLELTCGADLCRDAAQTMALLKRVFGRIDRLGKAEPVETAPAPEEEAPPAEAPPPADDRPFKLKPPGLHR